MALPTWSRIRNCILKKNQQGVESHVVLCSGFSIITESQAKPHSASNLSETRRSWLSPTFIFPTCRLRLLQTVAMSHHSRDSFRADRNP